MNTTEIEWTDRTWNPVSGCSHVSAGCKHCYAERLFPRPYPGRKFTDVRCHPERLEQPLKIKKPQKIFINSMSDLFHEDVPDAFIEEVFDMMLQADWHTYQLLTKRPIRMYGFMKDFLWGMKLSLVEHIWFGVSVEDQQTADERIPVLLKTPAVVRFVSCEPLLGPLTLKGGGQTESGESRAGFYWLTERPCFVCRCEDQLGETRGTQSHPINCGWRKDAGKGSGGIDWVICGGESGPKARPMEPEWVHAIYDQCQAAGVAFFMKQGSQANWPDFKNIESFPTRLQVREFPDASRGTR